MSGAWKPRPPAPSVEERIEALETRMGLLATSLQDFGWRLAQLDRERLEELKRLRQDVDSFVELDRSQRVVNEDAARRLGELEKALGTLLATKEPPDPELPALKAAARTLARMGYTWEGGELWKPPLGKPPRFFGDSEGGAA